MITPTMLCSTGVHSIPNPRAGWTVGDPKTRMVAVTGADSAADDWTGCPTKGSGPTVVVKGTAEDPVCSWENAGETYKDSTRMAANFMFVLSSGGSTCAIAPAPAGYLTSLCRTRQQRTRRPNRRHALAVVTRLHIGDAIAED
jgi:hypothetical protein